MKTPKTISHIRVLNDSFEFQSNEEHQQGVAKMAAEFADAFGMKKYGELLGLLHDKGKEQESFQQHIKKESGFQPNIKVNGNYHHAYVGALLLTKHFSRVAPLLTNCIAGHHRGLYDAGDEKELLKNQIPQDVTDEVPQINIERLKMELEVADLHHLERMLFSCLVDADYLDTENFMQPDQTRLRGTKASMSELLQKLQLWLDTLKEKSEDTPVNHIRNYVQEQCVSASNAEAGVFSLTVPTGGGKTLSSVLWALHHAVRNNLQRIIIAIPYTSIIVQTAHVLKNIFGEENVLEHHSNIDYSNNKDSELTSRLLLATENWNYPIIVTTNVQLFESLFSNRPSACRKLHNIAKSVLILDEVQTLPIDFLRPIVDSLKTLNRMFGTSILFTTASQPVLTGELEGENALIKIKGFSHIKEIVPSDAKLYDKLRRVDLKIDDSAKDYEEIATQITQHKRVLCIVNTRKDAKEIFERLPKEGITLHLSRMMCPQHIRETIEQIKDALKNEENEIIRVVATQLIEAGVDIDFPIVFRQQAGLDSILQAAGRCNREGKIKRGITHVFSLQKISNLPRGFISRTNSARMALAKDSDWFAPETMQQYFRQLYSRTQTFDSKDIKSLLYNFYYMQFETAAKAFQLIEDNTIPIIINWKDSLSLIDDAERFTPSYSLMKQLAQYTVSVRQQDFNKLKEAGAIEELFQNIFVVRDKLFYDEKVGLITTNHWIEEILIK